MIGFFPVKMVVMVKTFFWMYFPNSESNEFEQKITKYVFNPLLMTLYISLIPEFQKV